jgi:hypothetical protein
MKGSILVKHLGTAQINSNDDFIAVPFAANLKKVESEQRYVISLCMAEDYGPELDKGDIGLRVVRGNSMCFVTPRSLGKWRKGRVVIDTRYPSGACL